MIRVRNRAVAGSLLAAALLVAGAASADPPPGPKNWLRPAHAPTALETKPRTNPWRVGGTFAVVTLLGGMAFYAGRRKKTTPGTLQTERLHVTASTRVGPKALAVVVEISGKRLLLGVTDQAVNTLAWLDGPAAEDDREPEGVRTNPFSAARREDHSTEAASGFLKLLRSTIGSGARPRAAADELARSTEDRVQISRRGPPMEEPIEGQVLGLAKRRKDLP